MQMANMYIRMSPYVAAFFRHLDENKPLSEWEPLIFADFSLEMRIIRQGLCSDKQKKFLSVMCYSQQSWKNICQGKLPIGGKTVFIRDQKKWPSCRELIALEGRSMRPNEELFDYLCIQLPSEAMLGGQIQKTDNRCMIDGASAKRLVTVMRDEFYHYYYEWCLQQERLFKQKGLTISKAEMMERFYAQYEIPMPKGACSQNTMRVIAKRLFDRGKNISNNRTKIQGEYFDYVGRDNKKIR